MAALHHLTPSHTFLCLCLFVIILLFADFVGANHGDKKEPTFWIAGYLPDYRFYIDVNETVPFLTDLILFSASTNDDSLTTCCLTKDHFQIARQARAYKEQHLEDVGTGTPLKLWLTVGGGGRSNHFLDRVGGTSLEEAIQSLAIENGFDGVDMDCEQITSQNDYLNYLSWIRRVAPRFKDAGLEVSVALHAGQFLYQDMYQSIDRVNLMAYDMPGGYHASLQSVQRAVERLISSGCPANKIVLGIPAYARHTQQPGNVKTFAELMDEVQKINPSSPEKVPIDDFVQWKGFLVEGPKAVREKVSFARDQNLGGVFLWELGQDKQTTKAKGGILLEAAATGIKYREEEGDGGDDNEL